MNKKLTDKEIVKALECCILGDCQSCFYGDTDQRHCRDDLMQNALDLINHQQAEIERLRYNLEAVLDERADHSEAYKEFAERLKEVSQHEVYCDNTLPKPIIIYHIIKEQIDNLLKELVGDTDV